MKKPSDNFIHMSVSELTAPHDGRIVYLNRWWCVTDKEEVLFFRTYNSPQCNSNQEITKRLCVKDYIKSTPVFIPIAFVPVDWSGY
jgi:hypothetical protein